MGQQLVTTVSAGVGERPERSVLATHEQDAAFADRLRPLISRLCEF
jgi:hypothetical protein